VQHLAIAHTGDLPPELRDTDRVEPFDVTTVTP
jgi:hypothetical protein